MPTATARPVRVRRLAAALLDGALALVVALAPAAASPVDKGRLFGVGLLLGAAYLLLRDGVPYAEWGPRSLGKRWIGLRPYRTDGAAVTWAVSARRNATVGGAALLWAVVYLVGGVLTGPVGRALMLVAAVVVAVEAALVLLDPAARRLGDRLAGTRVVEARA
jgi:uncharacterized RDD family membrane protein YckC